MSNASFIFVACLTVVAAVATVELDGTYAQIRKAECAREGRVWRYVGDLCVREAL